MKRAFWLIFVVLAVGSRLSFAHEEKAAESKPVKPKLGATSGQMAREAIERRAQTEVITTRLAVDHSCLDESRRKLMQKIEAKTPIAFNELTDFLIAKHAEQGKKSADSSSQDLNAILLTLRSHTRRNLHEMKVDYEKLLQSKFNKRTLYNVDAVSLTDVCTQNRLECYSGTVLNQVLARKILGRDGFNHENPVIIFEEGHLLPGYLVKKGEDWQLIGIETTAEGPALLDYKLVKDLKRPVRIVDANDWLLTEIFKDCLVSPHELGTEMLDKVATQYGINPDSRPANRLNPVKVSDFSQSIFSFGTANAPKGDRKREYFDKRDRSAVTTRLSVAFKAGEEVPKKAPKIDLRPLAQAAAEIFESYENSGEFPKDLAPLKGFLDAVSQLSYFAESYDPNLEVTVMHRYGGETKYPLSWLVMEAMSLANEHYDDAMVRLVNHPRFDPNLMSENKVTKTGKHYLSVLGEWKSREEGYDDRMPLAEKLLFHTYYQSRTSDSVKEMVHFWLNEPDRRGKKLIDSPYFIELKHEEAP